MRRVAPLLLLLACKAPPPPPSAHAPEPEPGSSPPLSRGPHHPDPATVARNCRFAFSAPPAERAHAIVADCAHIYTLAACKDAWVTIATLAPSARLASVPTAIAACATVYCPILPDARTLPACLAHDTTPAAWSALQTQIFRFELGDAEAAALARVSLEPSTTFDLPASTQPSDACATPIAVELGAPTGDRVLGHGDPLRVAPCAKGTPDDVGLQALLRARAAAAPPACRKRLDLRASPDTIYARVVQVMDLARAVGLDEIVFAVNGASPSPPPTCAPSRCTRPPAGCALTE